jgi:hypothetical protein
LRLDVIGRPGVDEAVITWAVGQDHPSGAARLRPTHCGELSAPALQTAEVAIDRFRQGAGFVRVTESGKIVLMQDHRVGRDQLLALQPVDQESWALS